MCRFAYWLKNCLHGTQLVPRYRSPNRVRSASCDRSGLRSLPTLHRELSSLGLGQVQQIGVLLLLLILLSLLLLLFPSSPAPWSWSWLSSCSCKTGSPRIFVQIFVNNICTNISNYNICALFLENNCGNIFGVKYVWKYLWSQIVV